MKYSASKSKTYCSLSQDRETINLLRAVRNIEIKKCYVKITRLDNSVFEYYLQKSLLNVDKCNQINKGCLPSDLTANVKVERTSVDLNMSEVWIKTEESFEIKKDVTNTKVQDNVQTPTEFKPYSHETDEKMFTTTELHGTDFHQQQINNECSSSEFTTNVKIEEISIDSNPLKEEWLKTEENLETKDLTKMEEKDHSQTHSGNKPYKCEICKKQFTRNDHLKVHLRTHTGIKPYECELCEKQFTRKAGLNEHLQTHTGIKPHTCKICKKQFTRNYQLKVHLQIHTGIKPYECELCEKQFTQKSGLNEHLQTHTGTKPHACKICRKQFTRNNYLKVHLRIHTGTKPYQCKICEKRFTQKTSLNIHLRTHTQIKPYECEICEKQFTYKSSLNKHLQIHTGIKPYKCEVCKKRFFRKYNLKIHLRIHTRMKPYKCEICKKRFNVKCNLKFHLEKHTTDIKPDSHEIDKKVVTTTELHSTHFHQQQINNESSELTTDVKIEEISIDSNSLEEEWLKTEENFEIKEDVTKTEVKDDLNVR